MIGKNIIDNVFSEVINNHLLTVKCGRDYIVSRLNQYTSAERQKLMEGKLNPLEEKDYHHILSKIKNLLDSLEDVGDDEWLRADLNVQLDKYKEKAYKYERRIVQGYHINDASVDVDENAFQEDKSSVSVGVGITPGPLEQQQVDSQKDIVFTDKEISNVKSWSSNDYKKINGAIYHTDSYNSLWSSEREALDKRMPTIKRNIDSAIDKSNGLTQSTVFYRAGFWDIHLNPGDHGKWKGYTSLTYNENVADNFNGYDKFKIKCLVPAGVKGLALNDDTHNMSWNKIEHEFLLGRNTGYTVVSVDYENYEAVVLIDV